MQTCTVLTMLPIVEGNAVKAFSERSRVLSFASIVSGAGNSGSMLPSAMSVMRCLHFANSIGKNATLEWDDVINSERTSA